MWFHSSAFLLLILTAAPAVAQLTPEQARAVADKSVVTVALDDRTLKGRLVALDNEQITIEPSRGPSRVFPLSKVVRVNASKPDSTFNGTLKGALLGAGYCVLVCAQGTYSSGGPALVIMGAVVGGFIGSLVDAAHTDSVSLYRRPSTAPPRRSPGVFFTVRF